MSTTNLKDEFNTVSLEFSNPFAKLGSVSISRFKSFLASTADYLKSPFDGIDVSHPNGLYVGYREVDDGIKTKKINYVDLTPITVYAPPILKAKVKLLDYALALKGDMSMVETVLLQSASQVQQLLGAYISTPARLQDPSLIAIDSPAPIDKLITTFLMAKKVNEKLTTTSLQPTERPYSDVYARYADYVQVNKIAYEINEMYATNIRLLDGHMARIKDVNQLANDLLTHCEKDDQYAMSGHVAGYLTKTIFELAQLTEFAAATLYNAQVFLKAVSDTNIKLKNAVAA
jgi:hypothetical protein